MSSMALSGRVLVLTGRFSVMRMEVARLPDFAQAVAHDSIAHWRLGRIQMLTGDDKSSWFVVLKAGWKMLYLPDVRVDCAEELPPGGWWRSTSALMLRWYGNMARNNGRSLALGPRRIGWFTWLCLLDQRIAPWTTLAGPVVMLKASFFYGTGILVAYALWVLGTRSLICVGEFLLNRRFHPLFPFLLYQTQLIGAVIKIITLHAPDRQRWTRQKLAGRAQGGLRGALSLGYTGLSFGLFLLAVIALSARLDPDASPGAPVGLEALVVRPPTPDDHLRLPCGWSGAAPCAAVLSGPPRPLPRPQ
jgi:glycosyltransferase Alg8